MIVFASSAHTVPVYCRDCAGIRHRPVLRKRHVGFDLDALTYVFACEECVRARSVASSLATATLGRATASCTRPALLARHVAAGGGERQAAAFRPALEETPPERRR